jgi:hypothetical protein
MTDPATDLLGLTTDLLGLTTDLLGLAAFTTGRCPTAWMLWRD